MIIKNLDSKVFIIYIQLDKKLNAETINLEDEKRETTKLLKEKMK